MPSLYLITSGTHTFLICGRICDFWSKNKYPYMIPWKMISTHHVLGFLGIIITTFRSCWSWVCIVQLVDNFFLVKIERPVLPTLSTPRLPMAWRHNELRCDMVGLYIDGLLQDCSNSIAREHWSYFSLTESHRYVAKMSYRAQNFSEELNMNDTFRKGVFDG